MQWEAENPSTERILPRDYAKEGAARNLWTRSESASMIELQTEPQSASALFDGDELYDLRSNVATVEAGDLIEIRYRKKSPEPRHG